MLYFPLEPPEASTGRLGSMERAVHVVPDAPFEEIPVQKMISEAVAVLLVPCATITRCRRICRATDPTNPATGSMPPLTVLAAGVASWTGVRVVEGLVAVDGVLAVVAQPWWAAVAWAVAALWMTSR